MNFQKCFPVAALSLLTVLSLPRAGLAHHDDPTSDLRYPNALITAGTGTMIEVGHDHPVQVYLAVEYRGFDVATSDHHVNTRYFWVSGQVSLGDGAQTLVLNIVPATRINTSHEGINQAIRYAPVEITRDMSTGLSGSVKVQVIGWSRYEETPFGGVQAHGHEEGEEEGEEEVATFTRFSQIAADVVGLRYAGLGSGGNFFGGQVGTLQAGAGASWNPDEAASVRLSLGGRGGLAAGRTTATPYLTTISQGEFFARMEFLLNTAITQLRFYAEGGYQVMGTHLFGASSGSGFRLMHEGHDHATSETQGNPFLMIGVQALF